ncbi:acyltransferase [Planococcus salinus]|uniref:acyltransferase n=1 Tax=Planococcus salinus TaxID=1848460 RepID=UPI001314B81B|nr:acyltransferase [Planococcus salinus]
MKKEIKSIYFIRVFAMLMVVLVHVTAPYTHLFSPNTIQHISYHFVNNIVRVEAGLFIMLVGIVFFYNYRNRELTPKVLLDYFRKRVVYILIPYIIWSLIYEADAIYYNHKVFDMGGILDNILHGGSKYQLHFISLVVQFYLFFPIMLFIVQKSAFLRKYLWAVGVVIEFVYYFVNMEYRLTSGPFFVTIISPFLLGAWIGLHYEAIKAKITGSKTVLLGLAFLCAAVPYVLIRYQNAFNTRVPIPEELYKLIGIGFLVIGGLYFFHLSERLVVKLDSDAIEKVKNLAYYSFGYYLLHPYVITQVNIYFPIRDGWFSWHFMIFFQYVLVVVICYFVIWWFHRFIPLASFVFGKLPKKAPLFWEAGKERLPSAKGEKA